MKGLRMSRREVLWAMGALAAFALVLSPLLWFASAPGRAACASNLKQWGVVMKMYSSEDRGGMLPPLSSRLDNWSPSADALYPDYLGDLNLFICPGSPHAMDETYRVAEGSHKGRLDAGCVDSLFYNYTGYAIRSDAGMLALFMAYEANPPAVILRTLKRIPIPEQSPGQPVASNVPIMWDRVFPDPGGFNHAGGGNVLHMDGHVEFIPYSDANNSSYFPITRLCGETIGSVLPLAPPHCQR